MSKWKKGSKRDDDEFLDDDEDKPAKKQAKPKAARAPVDASEVMAVELGNKRRVTVGTFKGVRKSKRNAAARVDTLTRLRGSCFLTALNLHPSPSLVLSSSSLVLSFCVVLTSALLF